MIDSLREPDLQPRDFWRQYGKLYGWSYKMVLRLVKTKGFPSYKPIDASNRYLIKVAKVDDWVSNQEKKPKPYK